MFTAETTAVTLEEACQTVGLESAGARLLRLGSNAVYRLTDPIVVRIARSDRLDDMSRTIAVARWLASTGYPSVRALDVAQPVVIDGSAATFWAAISDGESYAPLPQVAELIKRLHSLTPPADLKLPDFEPFGAICSRLAASTWLSDGDAEFLSERTHRVQALYGKLNFSLPRGVIHGDANVGNVLQDDDGTPVLIDLDSFAIGPREWDLVQTAMFYDCFGWHTRSEYDAFVAIYGFDIMSWPGYPVLRDIRELHMVTWLTQNANTDQEVAVEAEKRIDALRTGASRRDWKPY